MTYDDTFDFGPFLSMIYLIMSSDLMHLFSVSCTMFKAVMFRDPVTGATPTIPLSYCLHEQRDTKTHTRNVRMMAECVKELEEFPIPFVVDGDKAIYNSWKKLNSKLLMLRCWNHIHSNLDEAFHKSPKRFKKCEKSFYKQEILNIFRQDSKLEAYKCFADIVIKTNSDGSSFVPTFLLEHVKKVYMNDEVLDRIGKFASQYLGLYDDLLDQGPTNQREEGHHDLMRRFQEENFLEIDAVVVVLGNLCDYFFAEIQKSKFGVGKWEVVEEFKPFFASLDKNTMRVGDLPKPMDMVESLLSMRQGDVSKTTDQEATNVDKEAGEENKATNSKLLDLSNSLINLSVAETPLGEAFNILAGMDDAEETLIDPVINHEEEIDAMWQDDGLDIFETVTPPKELQDLENLDIIQLNPFGNLEEEIDAMWQDDGLDLFEAQIPPVNIIEDVIHAEDLWGHEDLNADELDNLDIIQMEKMKEDDIICEYAKSNRSTCKICGNGIEKKTLRVAKIMEVENRRRQQILSPFGHTPPAFSV